MQHDVSGALRGIARGEAEALEQLFSLLYADLRQVARGQLRRLRPGDSLSTTGLVHESYLKFAGQERIPVSDRAHFYAVAAMAMRQILVDWARKRRRAKRGAGVVHLDIDEQRDAIAIDPEQILEVDEALERLAGHDARLARVVELRFFAGFGNAEIAQILSLSERTVRVDWVRAKAWLREAMQGPPEKTRDR
jgi:RNA polymerase sigma factor (TIGR02999 family)